MERPIRTSSTDEAVIPDLHTHRRSLVIGFGTTQYRRRFLPAPHNPKYLSGSVIKPATDQAATSEAIMDTIPTMRPCTKPLDGQLIIHDHAANRRTSVSSRSKEKKGAPPCYLSRWVDPGSGNLGIPCGRAKTQPNRSGQWRPDWAMHG